MAQPKLNHHLSSMDSLFLYFEKKEAPMNIGSTIIMDGTFSFTEFKDMVAAKLPLLPRYQQKLVQPLFNTGFPTWEFDTNFDINRHIFDVTLDAPGTMEELRVLAGKIHSTLLDRTKPLWEIYVVSGLEGDRSALVTKVHHAMADGVSGVDLMEIVLDTSPVPTPPPALPEVPQIPAKAPRVTQRLFDNWLDGVEESLKNWNSFRYSMLDLTESLVKDPSKLLKPFAFNLLPTITSPAPSLVFNKANTGHLELSWSEFSFADFHAIRGALGGTINDVGLSVLGGAVSKYLKLHHDTLNERSLRLMVPVNMRHAEQNGTLGNMISMLPVEIPLDMEDPMERHAFIINETGKLKEGCVAEELSLVVNLWGLIPASTQALLGTIADTPVPIVNMVCTNVPGPKVRLYVQGKLVTACYPYVPTAYHVGMSCAIFSYDKKLFFGLTADAKAAPDLNQNFKPLLEQSFNELLEAAGISKPKAPVVKLLPKNGKAPKAVPEKEKALVE